MLHGREARLPADLMYGPPPDEAACTSDFVSRQQETLWEAFRLAREELRKAAQRSKRHYDMRVRPTSFPVGSHVWCLVPRRRQGRYPKWQSPYERPFEVLEQLGPVTYKITQNNRAKPWVVHADKLKAAATPVNQSTPDRDLDVEDLGPAAGRPRRLIRHPSRYLQIAV